ncbi:MAG: hypothetical protein KTR30_05730 [Saprospiraceae bacterium]|nr:hypothetical protein [Saprospiraceae bacterium]
MKKLLLSGLLCFLFFGVHAQYEDDRTGYEGDYFSLEGALDLFRESSTIRNFERRLNSEEYYVNNLDLNYDGRIDYVRVEHRQQGNFHAIVLQAVVDRYEIQDVAVIELEVIGRREAVLQIIGDEDLYGREVIVEPREDYADNRGRYHSDYGTYVNVFYWRPVQHILGRQYRTYVSPYRWRSYPTWWAPRIQLSWGIFRPRIVIYSNRFIVVRRHRVVRVHNFYRPYRTYCPTVLQRTNTVRVRQGRQPINRGQAGQPRNRNAGNSRNRNEVVQNPRNVDRANSRQQASSSVSRKRTQEAAGQDTRRRSTAEASQRSRSYETPSRTSRNSAPKQRTAETRKPSRTYSQGQGRSRSASTQTRTPAKTRSSQSRSSSRSSSPQVRQPSRSKASSSRSTTRARSSTPSSSKARSSSGSRSRAATTSPSKSRKSSTSSNRSKSSSSSGSRSRSSSSSSKSRKGRGQ